jgi:hypothetical protein
MVVAAFWIVFWIVFARDLRHLRRAPVRLRVRSFYGQTAQRHSRTGLFLGFMMSLLFVAGGGWMLFVGANLAVAILCVTFFALCAVAWGYALFLKLQAGASLDETDDIGRR